MAGLSNRSQRQRSMTNAPTRRFVMRQGITRHAVFQTAPRRQRTQTSMPPALTRSADSAVSDGQRYMHATIIRNGTLIHGTWQPAMPGLNIARGTTGPEFSTIRAARNAREVLRSAVTGLSIPGGTWFIDVALREAINAGLIAGPRIYCAGRFLVTYGSIADNEPSCAILPHRVCGNSDQDDAVAIFLPPGFRLHPPSIHPHRFPRVGQRRGRIPGLAMPSGPAERRIDDHCAVGAIESLRPEHDAAFA